MWPFLFSRPCQRTVKMGTGGFPLSRNAFIRSCVQDKFNPKWKAKQGLVPGSRPPGPEPDL